MDKPEIVDSVTLEFCLSLLSVSGQRLADESDIFLSFSPLQTLLSLLYFFLFRGFSHEKQKLGRRGTSLRVKEEEEEEEEERGGLV